MDEDQNKSDADSFEDGLRQILSHGPPDGRESAGKPPMPRPRPENRARETAEAERKTLFWFKLMRPLAMLALIALLALFVLRITAPRG